MLLSWEVSENEWSGRVSLRSTIGLKYSIYVKMEFMDEFAEAYLEKTEIRFLDEFGIIPQKGNTVFFEELGFDIKEVSHFYTDGKQSMIQIYFEDVRFLHMEDFNEVIGALESNGFQKVESND